MNQFVGEIMCVGFTFAPADWAPCDGRSLPISQYEALYSLIGTTYGGDGINTFNLPDLRGRTPLGMGQLPGGSNYLIGQQGGAENVTVNSQQYPQHNHPLIGSNATGNSNKPASNLLASGQQIYNSNNPLAADALNSVTVTPAPGGNQPHSNLQPYLTCTWIIALNGIYPTRN